MKFPSSTSVTACAFSCVLLLTTSSAIAAPLHKNNHRHVVVHTHRVANKVVVVRPAPLRTGFRVATLPRGYRLIREGGATFYSYNNVRYRKSNGFFIVV